MTLPNLFQVMARIQERQHDGDGIDNVEFRITDTGDENVFYRHSEKTSPFCTFGQQGNTCVKSKEIVYHHLPPGLYHLQINVTGSQNKDPWLWKRTYEISIPELP